MIYKEYVPYVENVEVIEKRAPTGESIRLYKEMEEKAEKSIINIERFGDNELNGIVTYMEMDILFPYDKIKAHIKFSINGKEYHKTVDVLRTYSTIRQKSLELLYMGIIEELAKTFTIEINKIKYLW